MRETGKMRGSRRGMKKGVCEEEMEGVRESKEELYNTEGASYKNK